MKTKILATLAVTGLAAITLIAGPNIAEAQFSPCPPGYIFAPPTYNPADPFSGQGTQGCIADESFYQMQTAINGAYDPLGRAWGNQTVIPGLYNPYTGFTPHWNGSGWGGDVFFGAQGSDPYAFASGMDDFFFNAMGSGGFTNPYYSSW